MSITSPGGQTIDIVGPSLNQFGFTGPLPWQIQFLPCSETPAPDAGFSPIWNNNQNWLPGAFYNGSYHPYSGCLEDFNTGPVDGVWTLNVTNGSPVNVANIVNFQVIPCNLTGLDCFDCEPNGGEFVDGPLADVCNGVTSEEVKLLPFWSDSIPDSTSYDYLYLISNNDTLVHVDSILIFADFDPGLYEICGLSYLSSDSLRIPNPMDGWTISEFREELNSIYNLFCAELSDNCMEINILGHDTTYIEESRCLGEEYIFIDTTITTTGIYNRSINSSINCDSIVNLNIEFFEPIDTLVNVSICSGQSFLFGGDLLSDSGIYFWDSLSPQGCDSLVELHLNVIVPPTTNIDTVLCNGEEITVGPNTYNMTGDFQILIDTDDPCDSLVNLRLQVLDPIVNIQNDLFLNCNSSPLVLDASGSSGLNLSYQWEDIDNGGLGFNSSSSAASVEVILGGNYQLIITDSMNGRSCSATANTPVIADLAPPQLAAIPPTLSCAQQIGVIQTNPISTIVGYEWSGPNGYMSNSPFPIVTSPGDYELIVEGQNGCADTIVYSVAADTLAPVFSLMSVDTLTCQNDQVLLQAMFSNPNYQLLWEGPNNITFSGNNFLTTVEGEYSLSVFDTENGCRKDTTFEVQSDIVIPQFNIDTTAITCSNPLGQISVISSESYTYSWENQNGFLTNDSTFLNANSGPYFLSVIAQNGCEVLDTISIPVDTLSPEVVISSTTISCSSPIASITAMSNDPMASYSWSTVNGPFSISNEIQVSVIEEYSLEVESLNGCTVQENITPDVDTIPPALIIGQINLDCNNTSELVIPLLIEPFTSIEWIGPNNFQSFSPTPTIDDAGLYLVNITGDNGCIYEQEITVNADTILPDLQLQTDSLNCNNLSANLTANSLDAISIMWNGPNSFSNSNFNITVNSAGAYTAVVEGSNGCLQDSTIIVDGDFDGPNINFDDGTLTCTESAFLLGDSTISTDWSYQWIGPNSFLSQEDFIEVVVPGLYQVFVTGENGCQSIDQIQVDIDTAVVQFSIDSDTLNCTTNSFEINPLIQGAYDFVTWTYPDNSNSNIPLINISEPGTYNFETVGANGCSNNLDVEIVIDTIAPIVSIDSTNITCQEETPIISINLQANTPQITWTGPNGFSSVDPNPEVDQPGEYFINVTNLNGCVAEAMMTVVDDRMIPVFSTSNDTINCSNPTVNLPLNFNGNYSVLWEGPNSFSSIQTNPTISNAGIYQLILTDVGNGCQANGDVEIFSDTIAPVTTIENFELSCAISQIEMSTNDTSPNWMYQWSGPSGFSSMDSNPVVGLVGEYGLQITGENGCSQLLTTTVVANDSVPQLEIIFDTITCSQPNANIFVSADLVGTNFSWSGPDGFVGNQFSFEVAEGGTYEVEGTAPNGCQVLAGFDILEDTLAPVFLIEDVELNCNLPAVFVSADAQEELTYFWTEIDGGVIESDSFLVSEAGAYQIEGFNDAGCSSEMNYNVITDFSVPQIDLIGAELNCQDTIVQIVATPATILTDQIWSGPNGFSSVDLNPLVSVPGDYEFLAIGENGCRDSFNTQVSADTIQPFLQITSDTITCLDSMANVQAIGSSPLWSLDWTGPGSFTSADVSFQTSFSGSYYLVVQSENFCENNFEIFVPVDQDVPQVSVPDSILNCNQPSLLLSPSVNQIVNSFSWSDTSQEISNSPQLTVSNAGQYFLNIVADNGCEAQTTFIVQEDFLSPTFTTIEDIIDCKTDSVVLNLTANNYSGVSWTGPFSFNSLELQPSISIPGIYTFDLMADNGCDTFGQIFIQADTMAPIINLSSDTITCSTDSVLINIDGAFDQVVWSDANGTIGTDTMFWIDSPGEYQGLFQAENGCLENYVFNVLNDFSPPSIDLSADTITCNEPSALIEVLSSNTLQSIEWSGPNDFLASNMDTSVNLVGWYYVTAFGVNGCEQVDSILVIEDIDLPLLNISSDTLDCTGNPASISITDDPDIQNYLWTGPNGLSSLNPTFESEIAGAYSIEVLGFNGCTTEYFTEIFPALIPPTLNLNGANQLDCNSSSIELSTTVPTVAFDFETNWIGHNGVIGQGSNTVVNQPGQYFLEFLNINNQCSSLDSILIELDTLSPVLDVSALNGLTITCDIPAVLLQGFVNGNAGDFDLNWIYENDTISTSDNIEVNNAGEFSFNAISNINGCVAEELIIVDISNEVPAIDLQGTDLINCYTTVAELTAEFNLTNDFEINWFEDGVLLANLVDQSQAEFTVPGNYVVQINNLLNGCSNIDSIIVEQDIESPIFSYDQSNELNCFNSEVVLSFVDLNNSPLNYYWIQGSDTVSSNANLTIESPLSLNLTAQFIENGCSEFATVQIEVGNLGPSDVDLNIEQPNCPDDLGEAVLGDIQGGLTPYMYSFNGAPFQSSSEIPMLVPGTYEMNIQDLDGCELKTLIVIEPAAPVFLELGDDQTIVLGDSIQLLPISPSLIDTYDWNGESECLDCDRIFVAPLETTEYILNVLDHRGCPAEDRVTIFVKESPAGYFPTAFSPNNDGNNDFYQVNYSPAVSSVDQFTIFSRWGEVVFQSNGFNPTITNQFWDGKFNGQTLNPGVFIYVVEVTFKNGKSAKLKGDITLLK